MRRTLTSVLLLALVITQTGCRKYLEFDGEDLQPRLVLNGMVEADSLPVVQLSRSRGVIDPAPTDDVTNGTVTLFDGSGNAVGALQHVGAGRYQGTVPVPAGVLLTVRAEAPGLGSVEASDRVPVAAPSFQWDTVTVANSDPDAGFGNAALEFIITLTDPTSENDHYLIEAIIGQRYSLLQGFDPNTGELLVDTILLEDPTWEPVTFSSADQVLLNEDPGGPGTTRAFFAQGVFSDDLFNGNVRQLRLRTEYVFRPATIILRIAAISEAAYKYYSTRSRYAFAEGDPFAEPVQVFTNVSGGLGIWGTQHARRIEVDLW
jgi:hypothetical protein